MPFEPDNDLWKKSHKSRAENKETMLEVLFGNVSGGFAEKYSNLMFKAANGTKLLEGEKEFCDRYERNLPYVAGKRAPIDNKGQTANTTIQILQYGDKDSV